MYTYLMPSWARDASDHEWRIPAVVSSRNTSSRNASRPSSSQRQYSTARNNTPLFPLLCPFPLLPLPFGLPRVGIPRPGAEPAGARSAMSCAYPSRMALRRFCSDMMWFNLFCGVERRGLDRGAAEVDRRDSEPALVKEDGGESDVVLRAWLAGRCCSKWVLESSGSLEVCKLPLDEPERVFGLCRLDVDGSGAVLRWGFE